MKEDKCIIQFIQFLQEKKESNFKEFLEYLKDKRKMNKILHTTMAMGNYSISPTSQNSHGFSVWFIPVKFGKSS